MLARSRAALVAALLVSCSKTTPESTRGTSAATRAPPAPADAARVLETRHELPAAPPKTLERRATCAKPTCRLDAWLPDPAFVKSTTGDDTPAALWLQDIRAHSTVLFPRAGQLDVLVVVLDGKLVASADDAEQPHSLEQWTALYAPGGGVSLGAERSDTSAIVVVASTRASLAEALAPGKAQRWRERPGVLRTAELGRSEDLAWGAGAFHARIAFGGAGPQAQGASLEVLEARAGSTIPEHDHPSFEHIAILEGRGSFEMGGKAYAVEPGKIFHIPKGVRHAFRGSPTAPLLAVQSYTPSGEEQRFVRLAKTGSTSGPQPPK